jgi:glycosyltransferase involved in cell wall biosynthesis
MIYLDQRATGKHGIARFSNELGLRAHNSQKFIGFGNPFSPLDPFLLHYFLPKDAEFFISTNISGPFLGKIPYAICIHDLVQLDLPEFFPVFKGLYFKSITRLIASRARIIFTVSDFSKQRIIAHFGIPTEKIVVLGNAAGEIFHPKLVCSSKKHDFKYFLNYSSSKNYKNLQNIIDAYKYIEHRVQEKLVIIGSSYGLSIPSLPHGRILFFPQISDYDLRDYINDASAVIFTSLYEGFGIPIIEAFACDCLVITSNTAAMPEVADNAAILVDPYDVTKISEAMVFVSKITPENKRDFILKGRLVARRYSYDLIAQKLFQSVKDSIKQSS